MDNPARGIYSWYVGYNANKSSPQVCLTVHSLLPLMQVFPRNVADYVTP
jgi:hypothetical protein